MNYAAAVAAADKRVQKKAKAASGSAKGRKSVPFPAMHPVDQGGQVALDRRLVGVSGEVPLRTCVGLTGTYCEQRLALHEQWKYMDIWSLVGFHSKIHYYVTVSFVF